MQYWKLYFRIHKRFRFSPWMQSYYNRLTPIQRKLFLKKRKLRLMKRPLPKPRPRQLPLPRKRPLIIRIIMKWFFTQPKPKSDEKD